MITAAALFALEVGAVATTFQIIVTIVVNLIIAAILGVILAPDAPTDARDTKGLQTVIRSNIAPRRVAYGESVTGGPYAVVETKGEENELLNMVIVLTGHPIEDVLGVFIEDEYINIAGPGGTTNDSGNDLSSTYSVNVGKFGTDIAENHITIIKNLGWGFADFTHVTDGNKQDALDDRARAVLISNTLVSTWTQPSATRDSGTGLYDSGYKLTNCAYIFVSLRFNRDVWSGFPRLKFHIKGKRVYNPEQDSSLVAEGADSAGTQSFTDPDTYVYTDNWATCILDYMTNTSYGLAARTSGLLKEIDWVETIQAVKDSEEIITTGLPSPDIGTGPRYTMNGIFEVSSTPISNMEALLTSGSGALIYAQGEYKLRAGVYRLPDSANDIINEDMIVSALSIRTHTPRADLFNKAAGVFVDVGYDRSLAPSTTNIPEFEPSDFAIVDPLDSSGLNPFEVIDDEEIIKEFNYPFTINEFEAQRLARIQLERIRQGLVISFEANLKILKFSVGDTVYLEILSNSKYANESFFNRLGLDDTVQDRPDTPFTAYYKQFKIISMEYTEQFTIAVTMLEESEEIYDWNEGDANLTDHELISNLIVDDPTGTVLQPSFIVDSPFTTIVEVVSSESGTNVSTLIRWQAPDRGATVNAIDKAHIASYRLEYGIVDNPSNPDPSLRVSSWIHGGTVIADPSVDVQGPASLETLYKDGTTEYDFRVRSTTFSGRASLWTYYSDDIGSDYLPAVPPASSNDFYYIKPINGTAIQNGSGTLTVEAHQVIGNVDTLISTGNKQLYVGGTTLVTVANGFTSPSDGYTGTFDSGDITGNIIVELREGSGGTILDTITLVDIADGADGGAGADAVYGFIEATSGLAWTQTVNGGAWNPSATFTNLDVTFVQGGLEVAKVSRRIDRDSDGILTDGGAATHAGGDLNTSRITADISGGSSQALTVEYTYLLSPDVSVVAETVITSVGADDGIDAVYGFIEPENGISWTRAPNSGAWTPSQLTTDLDCTFIKGNADVARIARRVTLNSSNGTFTVSTTDHKDTNLNEGDVTVNVTGSGTTAVTVEFDYLLSPDETSAAQTITSSQGGDDGDTGGTGPPGADGKVGWGHDLEFSATDADTVAWTAGTVKLADGTTYGSIAAGNTGNMTARTYIYLDSDVSTTVLQITTNPITAVGENKILITVAEDTIYEEAFFQVFGGFGGLKVAADEIAANSIIANNISASFFTGRSFTGGTFQTRLPMDQLSSPFTTEPRVALEITGFRIDKAVGSTDELLFSADSSSGNVFIGGTAEISDIAVSAITGWSVNAINAIRDRLGVVIPANPSGGSFTNSGLPVNISGTSDTTVTGNTPDSGVIVHINGNDISINCRVYDPGWSGWFSSNQGFTDPVYRVTIRRQEQVSPFTWTDVQAFEELTGNSFNEYDGEFRQWLCSYNINRSIVTVTDDPASGNYKYRAFVDYISGSFSSSNQINVFNYSELLQGDSEVAQQISVTDESTDTTCFPAFFTDADGNLSIHTGTNLTFNSSTGALNAGGPITGSNLSGSNTGDNPGVTSIGITPGALIDVTGSPVTGSGSITVIVDLSELTDLTTDMVTTDELVILDASVQKRKALGEIDLSLFNNDLGGLISDGTTTDAMLRWSGSAWVEETSALLTTLGGITASGFISLGNIRINNAGSLVIGTAPSDGSLGTDGANVVLEVVQRLKLNATTGEAMINCQVNGAVQLFYDNAIKMTTAVDGVDVTGDVGATTFAGITAANLVDKTAAEVIVEDWRFNTFDQLQFGGTIATAMRLQNPAEAAANWTRGILSTRLYWDDVADLWTNDETTNNDFSMIRFANSGEFAIYTRATTGSAYTLTDAALATYKRLSISNSGVVSITGDNVFRIDGASSSIWTQFDRLTSTLDVTQVTAGQGFRFRDRMVVSIWDSGNTDAAVMSHDSTNFNLTFINTSRFDIGSGLTGAVRIVAPLETLASVAGDAGFNIPTGVEPTSPVQGDIWVTATDIFARINSANVSLLGGGGVADGTTTDAVLRWSGSAWVQTDRILINQIGGITSRGPSGTNTFRFEETGTIAALISNVNPIEMHPTNSGFTVRFNATETLFQDPLKIFESAAAVGDTTAYGQFWVRDDDPNTPMFTTDTGVDFALNDVIADGTVTNAMLRWSGSAWVEETSMLVTTGGVVTAAGLLLNGTIGGTLSFTNTPVGSDVIAFPSTAGLRRITTQGGFAMYCDSSMLFHAGDNVAGMISDLSIVAGTTTENLYLTADNFIDVWTLRQTSFATAHQFQFRTDGGFQVFVPTSTAPFVVASTTRCVNLNADLLDGVHGAGYSLSGHAHSGFDRASSVLGGANVFSNIVVTNGITTAIDIRALTPGNIGAPTTTGGGASGTWGINITGTLDSLNASDFLRSNAIDDCTGAITFSGSNVASSGSYRFNDNVELRFGSSSDIRIDWDGGDLEVTALTVGSLINFRDNINLRIYDATDTEYLSIDADSTGGGYAVFNVVGLAGFKFQNANIFIEEGTTPGADQTGFGQYWVKTITPNQAWFTDDTSVDYPLGYAKYRLFANLTDNVDAGYINGGWYSDNATTYILTLEGSGTTNFPIGCQFSVWNEGSGTLTINEGSGTTLYYMDGLSAPVDTAGGMTLAQGGFLTIIRKTAAVYLAMGALGTP